MSFRLTYATMFDPPPEMHERFDAALVTVRSTLGGRHPLFLDGADTPAEHYVSRSSPIDSDIQLGEFALATEQDAHAAMDAAHRAFPAWRATPGSERVRLLRRVADVMEARVYEIAAALALEVGKNRMEALGEAQETVDFFRHYADDFEQHGGYEHELPNDPLPNVVSRNRSVMRPYGVWVVIAPFNFPLALAGGPTAAALVTGNTVVVKGATDTPWAGRLLADCIRDAGLPPGVFKYLSGSGREVGEALSAHPATAGITFTGSVAVGTQLLQRMASGPWPRPCIAEMGGKNPCIVTARADLDDAAAGIVRSAYGMGGQKCSALSRLYVDRAVADELIERMRAQIDAIRIGDPCRRENWLGPVINANAAANHARYLRELQAGGATLITGARELDAAEIRARLLRATRAGRGAARASAVAARDVPADPDAASGQGSRRGDAARQRHEPGAHGRLLRRRRRSAVVPRAHRGRRHLCESTPGRDHRRLARLPAVRRLERLGLHRQGDRVVLLPRAVPARAVAHGGRT